ncbi:ABC transporter substrate-binding protein [Pseudorhodoplanes sinuspersici]|nr:ABC transporter substrate-binding protein [Pseudorhodoplanes sinuspersici]RKE72635.1 putative ABC transport system substrate-binding protein [Pseudorhodoplanes sinuspersici]
MLKRFAFVMAMLLAAGSASYAQPKRVAIAGWGPHPTLDEAIAGFKKGLAEGGFPEGSGVVFDETNVNFDPALIPQMLTRLSGARPDLMATIATPVSVASRNQLRTRAFPIVFLPIADPVHAGLVSTWDKGDKLMTGSSVALDYQAVLSFFETLLPEMKRLGVLYDTGDDSSKAAVDGIEAVAGKNGMTIVRVGVDNPNELAQRVQSAVGRVDALFTVASGRIQQGMAAVSATADRAKLPVITSVPQAVQQNYALAAFAVSFGQSGEAAGKIAARILKGEDPASIPPYRATAAEHKPMINGAKLKALGLTLPPALANCNCVID